MPFPLLAPLAGIALKLSPVGKILKSIPRPVWIALAVIAAVVGLVLWHNHQVSAAYGRGKVDGARAESDRIVARAKKIEARANATNRKIASYVRSKTDEANRRTIAVADGLRLRGPGKAAYRCPGFAAAASGPQPATGASDVAGARLPSDDRAVVPWGFLVSHAQTCDLNLNEVNAWREWYDRIAKAWPKSQGSGNVDTGGTR